MGGSSRTGKSQTAQRSSPKRTTSSSHGAHLEDPSNENPPPSSLASNAGTGYFEIQEVHETDPQTDHPAAVRPWVPFHKSDPGPPDFLLGHHDPARHAPAMWPQQPYSTGNDVFDAGGAGASSAGMGGGACSLPNYPPRANPGAYVRGKVGRAMAAWPAHPSGFVGGQASLAASYASSAAGSEGQEQEGSGGSGGGGDGDGGSEIPWGAEYTQPQGLGQPWDTSQTTRYAYGGAGARGHWIGGTGEGSRWCSCSAWQQGACQCPGGARCRCGQGGDG